MAARVTSGAFGNAAAGGLSPPGERDESTLTHRTTAAASEALAARNTVTTGRARTDRPSSQAYSSDLVNGCVAMAVFSVSIAVLVGAGLGVKYLVSSHQ